MTEHDELRSLLGAHALNATSELEARRIERHLETCDECAHEVRLLRETTAELAWLPEPDEAEALVRNITERLPSPRRRGATRVTAAVVAISAAAAALFGVAVVRERSEGAKVESVLASATRLVVLQPQGGFTGTATLHLAGDEAALVVEDLPEAGKDRSYQLWAIEAAEPRSMAVFGGSERTVVFPWAEPADGFAVTIEPEGGSRVPTTDPVLVGA